MKAHPAKGIPTPPEKPNLPDLVPYSNHTRDPFDPSVLGGYQPPNPNPEKISIMDYVGLLKGRTAIRVFNKFREIKQRPYWGNHFWARGYCVDTVGLDEEMIRAYVKYQEKRERKAEQKDLDF